MIMNGLLVINKEKDMTSHDVVSKLRKLLNTKRIGHLGTLDPNATGVLVLCINDGCKLVPFLENDTKEYLAEVILGIDTNTYDITGEVVNKADVDINNLKIEEVLESFLGNSLQFPPIYSAIKVNGKKLYQYARNDEEVEIKPRPITINSIKYIEKVHFHDQYYRFKILVNVSKGTYIRSLCHDIGLKLGCYATMGDLTRTKSGKFTIEIAKKISEINPNELSLISLTNALDYYKIEINDESLLKKILNGMPLILNDYLNNNFLAFTKNNNLIAIYKKENNKFIAMRVWN